jgi:hypothetical protein
MNKSELKKLLKPLIKECIKEVIFEDGVLSGIVSEVNRGLKAPQLVESQKSQPNVEEENFAKMRQKSLNEQKQKINASRQKLLSAIGNDAYNGVNLFEDTTPIASAGPAPGAPPNVQGPLAGVAAHDPGVDISGLLGSVGRNWKAHVDAEK